MRALMELARRQLGLVTRAQALQLVTKDELHGLAARGFILQRRRAVSAVAGMPATYDQTVLAALLAADESAWLSHRTAAKIHGLRVPPPDEIDVLTLPDRRLHLDGVRHHRNQLIVTGDVTT